MLLGWAWRIPFLASIVLILIALFIRLRLKESPTFIELEKHEQVAEHPMREIFGHSFGSVLRGIGLRMAENGGSYLFNSLAVAYATGTVMVNKSVGPIAVAVASLIGMLLGAAGRAGCPTASAGCPSTASARWCCWSWPSRAGT